VIVALFMKRQAPGACPAIIARESPSWPNPPDRWGRCNLQPAPDTHLCPFHQRGKDADDAKWASYRARREADA
jgi:hypothetical protein